MEMAARLTRFYGLTPWDWLAVYPLAILRGFSRLMPRLRAEESLDVVDQLTVGINAAFAEGSTKAPQRRWREALHALTPRPPRATAQQLHALGIGFKRVVKGADGR